MPSETSMTRVIREPGSEDELRRGEEDLAVVPVAARADALNPPGGRQAQAPARAGRDPDKDAVLVPGVRREGVERLLACEQLHASAERGEGVGELEERAVAPVHLAGIPL